MSSLIFDTFKILLTALVILAVAQLSQRDTLLAAVLASIPLVSVLAMMWMNQDGATTEEIIMFSRDIVWLVLPYDSYPVYRFGDSSRRVRCYVRCLVLD